MHKMGLTRILAYILGWQNLHYILTFMRGLKKDTKGMHELSYWKNIKAKEGVLSNRHYMYFYTTHFGLDEAFYKGKKILDIGCGPRAAWNGLIWLRNV